MINRNDFRFEFKTISIEDCVFSGVKRPVDQKEMESLMKSIDTNGMLQPIMVCHARPELNAKWEIIDGLLRVYASEQLGIKTIQASVILKYLTNAEKDAFGLAQSTKNVALTKAEIEGYMNE